MRSVVEQNLVPGAERGGATDGVAAEYHIFHDGKDVENRDWYTKGRGWFIVHAGISKSEMDDDQIHLPRGGVVGMARIVDCVREMESRWFFGRFGFVLRDAFPLPLIPCRGQLGFFKLEPETCTAVAAAIREHDRAGKHQAEAARR